MFWDTRRSLNTFEALLCGVVVGSPANVVSTAHRKPQLEWKTAGGRSQVETLPGVVFLLDPRLDEEGHDLH